MKHPVRLQTGGGWGKPSPPAFSYALTRGAAWNTAKKTGLIRLGKSPKAQSNDNTRPIVPNYRTIQMPAWNTKDAWTWVAVASGDNFYARTALQTVGKPFGAGPGVAMTATRKDLPNAFAIAGALAHDESLNIRALVLPIDGDGEETKGHIWFLRVGAAGSGVLFQLRDGKPEVAQLSPTWTRAKENSLRALWALPDLDADQETSLKQLQDDIYSNFEALSLDRSTGRDTWLDAFFSIVLIPEPRGALQIVLEGGDTTCVEFDDVIATRKTATLWGPGSPIEVGSTGGAWVIEPRAVRFGSFAQMVFGPYFDSYGSDLDGIEYSTQAYTQGDDNGDPLATIDFERKDYAPPSDGGGGDDEEATAQPFEFKATWSTTDDRYAAWLYGFNAEVPCGQRTGLDVTDSSFDTNDLTKNSQLALDSKPITDVELSLNEDGSRGATVTMRDIKGRTLASIQKGIDGLVGRVAILSSSGAALMTQAIITRGGLKDAEHYAGEGGSREAAHVSKTKTKAQLFLSDGRLILEEKKCDPAIISDGKHLGYAIRQRLRRCGFSDAEMALVPADLGPELPKAAPGEDWASITDPKDTIGASIEGLLDRVGLGLRFYQNANGVWVLEPRPTASSAAFVTNAALSDPNQVRGGSRYVILSPLDWDRDNKDYYNQFRVIGGPDGAEITRDWIDDNAIELDGDGATFPTYMGRERIYETLRDSGLRTLGQVLYALRSLVDRYGRPGRFATFESYFVRQFYAGDLITLDGILCEVISWTADTRRDRMQIRVREVV